MISLDKCSKTTKTVELDKVVPSIGVGIDFKLHQADAT